MLPSREQLKRPTSLVDGVAKESQYPIIKIISTHSDRINSFFSKLLAFEGLDSDQEAFIFDLG